MKAADVDKVLAEIAKAGGSIEYWEDQLPFPQEIVDSAEASGWLKRRTTGGAAGVTESIDLTEAGRRLTGLPPRFSLYRSALGAIYRLIGRQRQS